ncbi:MAG: HD domain-containing phosphohydrolase [Bacillota bacterium]
MIKIEFDIEKIRYKLIIPIVLVLFFAFSFLTVYAVNYLVEVEEEHNREHLDTKITKTMSILSTISANPLWSYNQETLENNLKPYFEDKEIVNITVTTDEGEEYLGLDQKFEKGEIISKTEDIIKNNQVIGQVKVGFTPYYLNQNLEKIVSGIRRRVIFVLALVTIIVLSVIILIADKITKPIVKLSEEMASFDLGNEIDLKREDTGIKEIEEIKSNYTSMAEEINASYEQLEAYSQEVTAMNEELSEAVKETKDLNKRFDKMINLISNLALLENKTEKEFLSNLLNTAIEILPEVEYGSVYIYNQGEVEFIDAEGHDLEALQQLEIPADSFYNSEENIEIINFEQLEILNKQFMPQDIYKDFHQALAPIRETINFDLEINGVKKAGVSVDIAAEKEKSFSSDSVILFESFHNIATSFFKLEDYNKLQGQFTKELIMSIVRILEVYDEYTSGHSENVAETAANIASEMGLPPKKITGSYWAGMVHDIGKLLVPLDILNKEGSLTEEEYGMIKKHPKWGYEALYKSESLGHIAEHVLYHHEKWDGSGYPDHLAGAEIPIVSQILAVADAWDAMTSDRSYRSPLSKTKALQELKNNKGTQFSPQVVESFLKIIE